MLCGLAFGSLLVCLWLVAFVLLIARGVWFAVCGLFVSYCFKLAGLFVVCACSVFVVVCCSLCVL